MNEHMLAHALEWLEEKTKPLFVLAAFGLYVLDIVRIITTEVNPLDDLNKFLILALGALSIPFGVILLQELLELITNIADSNLISARRQFEIVLLVIIRSFFKSFAKVNDYVDRGEWGDPVEESVIKVVAIILMVLLLHFFRRMTESQQLHWAVDVGRRTNLYKQAIVVILVLFVLAYQLLIGPNASLRNFNDLQFIRLVFTGMIVIDALFLILSILKGSFPRLILESSLIIALIFARFPLFTSNSLSYALSVVGVGFATVALFLFYYISRWFQSLSAAEQVAVQGVTEHDS